MAEKIVDFDGKRISFPSDATDAEISAALKAIPASNAAQAPAAKTWQPTGDVLLDNAANVALGAAKKAARVGQMIPGVSAATDTLYGFQPGTSERFTQPSNTAQKVGGFLTDAALIGATGAADIPTSAPPGTRMIQPKSFADWIATKVGNATADAETVTKEALEGARKELIGKGPLTAEKVGATVAKYGKRAVALAAGTLGIRELLK